MSDSISRQAAIDFEKLINASDLIEWIMETYPDWCIGDIRSIVDHIYNMPTQTNTPNALETLDCISRAAAIEVADAIWSVTGDKNVAKVWDQLKDLPSVHPPKEIPKRVLWSGWKGYRDTRYKCPNCEKPVRNDDTYCHRCGQRLMFPHISFTNYVPGEKQDVIVRWDDEG